MTVSTMSLDHIRTVDSNPSSGIQPAHAYILDVASFRLNSLLCSLGRCPVYRVLRGSRPPRPRHRDTSRYSFDIGPQTIGTGILMLCRAGLRSITVRTTCSNGTPVSTED